MSKDRNLSARLSFLPIPSSTPLVWLNLAISIVISTIGLGVGFAQDLLSAQQVILFTVFLAVVTFLFLNYVAVVFETRAAAQALKSEDEKSEESRRARDHWRNNRVLIIAMVGLLIAYLLLTAGIADFRSIKNLIAFLVLA